MIRKIHEDHEGRLDIDLVVAELAKPGRQRSPRLSVASPAPRA